MESVGVPVLVRVDNGIEQNLNATEAETIWDHAQASKACNDVGYDVQIVISSRMN